MKILIVRLSSLGDILHFFPAVSDLRRLFPHAEIHWLIEPAFAELASWHDAITKVIAVPLRAHKKAWWKLPQLLTQLQQQLRAEHYDLVIDGQGLLKSALLARLTGARILGFAPPAARETLAARFYHQLVHVPAGLHIVEKNRQLIAALDKSSESVQYHRNDAVSADFGLEKFRSRQLQQPLRTELQDLMKSPYVVLLHGTTWDSKYWPESVWQEFVGLLAMRRVRCLLPWGNEAERQRAERLQQIAGTWGHVLPKCNLLELSKVLLHAQAFVAVETGIGHLAAILDVPGVMLHGPTDPNYSGILGKRCIHLTSGLACSPCFKRQCPKITEGSPPCQLALTPQLCLERLNALL